MWHVKRSAFASGVETEEQAGVADVEIDPNDSNKTQATTDSNTVFAPTEGTQEVVPVTGNKDNHNLIIFMFMIFFQK